MDSLGPSSRVKTWSPKLTMPKVLFPVVAVVLLALAACTVSGSLHGVCAEGECTELSLAGSERTGTDIHTCLDTLPEGGWAVAPPKTLQENPPACKLADTCNNVRCENCSPTSQDLWPHLNITLEHYNGRVFGVVISWDKPAHVTGYVVIVTEKPRTGQCGGGGDLTGLRECSCINITNPNTTNHTHIGDYLDNAVPKKKKEELHIRLIPTPWCDGPSTVVPVPQSCHNIRPGDCEICGFQLGSMITPPTNVSLTLLPQLREVFLTWEPGESYYGLPYPNISFFLKVSTVEDDSETSPWLQVIGRTNVTLQNLTLNVNYSVEIEAGDCGCQSDKSPVYHFYLDESTPLPSSATSSSLPSTSTVPQPSTFQPSILQPTPQTPATDPNEHLPVILSSLLTGIVALTIGVIIITAVAIRKYRRQKLTVGGLVSPSPKDMNDYPSPPLVNSTPRRRVLLIYSLDTSEDQVRIILQLLVQDLKLTLQNCFMEEAGDYVYPEVVWYDCSKLGRGEGMAQWVEREVRACDKVLCVCNKEFKREWEGEIEPIRGSLVSCIKNLYLGSPNEVSKYAIVLMHVTHKDYIPTQYFKMCRQFLCERNSVEDIAHYVLDTPPHTRQLHKSYQL